MWRIERTDEVANWINGLDDDAKESVLKTLLILREIGPLLGRPYVDTVKESKYKNMKELRIQCKKRIFRIFFIFDPKQNAVLLVGGDKRGDKKFYKRLIPHADQLYDNYLKKRKVINEE
jgi:hypothetical protein